MSISTSRANTISLRAVRSLLGVAMAQGHDIGVLLDAAGFDFNPLLEGPDQVSMRLYSRLYRLVMEALQDEAFGLNARHRSPPGTFRMMCRYIIHCGTLRDALVRMAEFFDFCDRFSDSAAPPRVAYTLSARGEMAVCRFHGQADRTAPSSFSADASVLYMMQRLCSWLIGRPLPLIKVSFSGGEVENAGRYADLFACPLVFGEDEPALWLPADVLNAPVVQNEESLAEFLRLAPYPLIAPVDSNEQQSTRMRVRQLLMASPGDSMPSVEDVAEAMHMSPRTLHRHLSLEATTFQKLKDECRKELAIAYIGRPELSITAVSLLMGFQDTSTFYRAFKKWTGASPGEYRARQDISFSRKHRQDLIRS